MATAPTVDALVQALRSASRPLDAAGQRLAVALYRTLAEGRPVAAVELASRTGRSVEEVTATLDGWPNVFYDQHRQVIGFWGLALAEMAHRLEVAGRVLHAWCAWDPLFMVPLLDEPARVESTCPVTGRQVSLTVTPDGVSDVSPAEAVVSFLVPTRPWDDDVIGSFCHHVLYLASEQAGRRWMATHPGTFLLSVEQAFEVGRRFDLSRFGTALAGAT
jgi:alkylmercury lyase